MLILIPVELFPYFGLILLKILSGHLNCPFSLHVPGDLKLPPLGKMEEREEGVPPPLESLLHWMGVMGEVVALPLETPFYPVGFGIFCLANPLPLGKMEEMERVVVPPLGTPP